MNGNTLWLWDFDDTLAHSEAALARVKADRASAAAEGAVLPEVPFWAWWHDPFISKVVAKVTEPMLGRWKYMDALGSETNRHMILTARVGSAVAHWLEIHKNRDDEVGRGIAKIERVISTSSPERKHLRAPEKKSNEIAKLLAEFPDVTSVVFIDDNLENLERARSDHNKVRKLITVHAGFDWERDF